VGGKFDALEHLALDKSVWQKLVRDGSEVFTDTWLKKKLKISYEIFIVEYINNYDHDVYELLGPPSDDLIEEACRRKKYGDCWQLDEDKVTGLVLENKKYKVVVEEQSRVSRLLEDLRKIL
jgi:hypothetical protein